MEGRGPQGVIGDTDSQGTVGPDPAAEDIQIVTEVNNQQMEMDTSIRIAHGIMREWEAVALKDQLGARTIGAPWAQSSDRKYPDHNSASLLRMSPMSSPLGAGPSGNMTLPTLIILINYI